ncbi:MAG: hypothetical protein WCL04_03905, partial [Verrucomicrobiota bacterium]
MKTSLWLPRLSTAVGLVALLALTSGSSLRAASGPPPVPGYPTDGGSPPPPGYSQGTPAAASRLVIQNGKIWPIGLDATLGKVVELLSDRYHGQANIILAGTAEVRVGDITLRLSEQNVNIEELADVLNAVCETSGRAFTVSFNESNHTNTRVYTLSLPAPAAAPKA